MQITVRISGGKVFTAGRTAGQAVEDISKSVMRKHMMEAENRAKTYPPQNPESRYKRTRTYYKSFKLEPRHSGNVYKYILSSDAVLRGRHYTIFVGGDAEGNRWGQGTGKWPIIRSEVNRVVSQMTTEMQREIESGVKKAFGL